MHKQNSRQLQFWLLLLTILTGALLGVLIVMVAGSGSSAALRRQLVLGANDDASPVPSPIRRQPATNDGPTPTFVPPATEELPSALPAPSAVDQPPTESVPTESVPTEPPSVQPTPGLRPSVVAAPPARPNTPPVPVRVDGARVRLEDTAWQGGYRQARGYAGRSATWIYGSGTEYTTMQAAVVLDRQPQGQATLRVEGMDAEGRGKSAIQITVNGQEIYRGANPLPDDDQPLESGTWGQASWRFDGGLLQPGQNLIRIRNLSPGSFGRPPFFMLDYAILVVP
jgi:hypothetical protein